MNLFNKFINRCKENLTLAADWSCAMVFVALIIVAFILGAYTVGGHVIHQSEGTEARLYNNSFTAPDKTTCTIEMKTDAFKTEAAWIKCSKWWRAHLVAEKLAFPAEKNANNTE